VDNRKVTYPLAVIHGHLGIVFFATLDLRQSCSDSCEGFELVECLGKKAFEKR
jgi:hypothetical protein